MEDQTDPPFPSEPPTEAVKTTSTVTTTATSDGPPQHGETMVRGASGRFWIVVILTFGSVFIPTLFMIALIAGRTIDPTVFLSIYGAYLGVAAIGIGTYLGAQGQKPKT